MKKILFAASECVPFVKTGGLADVVGSLPKYFDKTAFDVRVVLPAYTCIADRYRSQWEYVTHFYSYFNGRDRYVGILRMQYAGVTFYFIDNEDYFSGLSPYTDYLYDLEKFAFFSKAVLSILPSVDFRPDLIHCHDWHTGLIPVWLKTEFSSDPFYRGIKSIITIHNLKFQGVYSIPVIQKITGLSHDLFTYDKLATYNDGNYLKGGIVYADYVTTVSHTYAEEIKTPFYGENLEGLFFARRDSFFGILNGLDYDEWNPEKDPLIVTNYSAETFRRSKKKNKTALQNQLGLPCDEKKFMVGIVSRLTSQKGFDLIAARLSEILALDLQLVVLGTGEAGYEQMFAAAAGNHPEKVSVTLRYSEALSHRIYAACDAFLMPSMFEPCGLSQLMSLRYGTLPIVRETGGLKDTVEPYNRYTGEGTGFSFSNFNADEMLTVLQLAHDTYYGNKRAWNKLVDHAMAKDFSWNASCREYEALYRKLLSE